MEFMTDEWRIRELLEYIQESHCDPEEACAECPELLPRIRYWLERMQHVESQIDVLFPASRSALAEIDRATHLSRAKLPQIGGYDVEGILGRGGMGIVYRARHQKLNRIVALKMLVAGPYASPQEVARFVRESQAVAELQHPNIVQVHDVGDLDGRPYFTMEFVEGGSLAQALAGAPQAARYAARLVATLAGAVHLAHIKGIIHRDLKPANILLARDGSPKIADFGLARHVDGDPGLTRSDARVGTPSYMAPEQALGKLGTVGLSVDIYALGAILYEMLTGRPPFRAETAIETERQVITVEAAPPSRLNTNVPRDLETICLKCLHKDPSRRYSTAVELADDLDRFLAGQPVQARPVGLMERVYRWGTRHRGAVAALLGFASLLSLIVVGSLWAAAHFRKLAREKGDLADQKGRLAVEKEREREKAVVAEKREAGLRRQSETQGKELRRNLYLTEMNLAGQAAYLPSGLGRVNELLARWGQERPDLRNWEWYFLNSLCHRCLVTWTGHAQGVHNVAWNKSGARLASAGADRIVCIWNASDERPPLRLIGHGREVLEVAWSPDSKRLATASWDGTVRIWDTTTGTEIFRFPGHTAEVFSVAWSPDGNWIASGGNDRSIRIWNAVDGTSRVILNGHEGTVTSLDWSPDSLRLASSARDTTVRVWDVAAGTTMHTLTAHNNWVNHVTWSADGARLASASNDRTLRIWDPDKGQELLRLSGHQQGVSSVAWSPDGAHLASSSDDQTVKVWDAATGTEEFSLRGHAAPLTTVAWNPKGNQIASAGYDRMIKIWDASAGPETPALKYHESPIQSLAWCQRDSALCASADAAGYIKIWDTARHTVRRTWRADSHQVRSVCWHPAGIRLAAASGNGAIRIWNVASENEPVVLDGHDGVVTSVAWSPDGRRLASGGFDRTIRIWDSTTGNIVRVIKNHQHSVYTVAWSPNGQRLASASGDRTAKIWDVATGEEVLCYRGHPSEVVTVAWNPDGTTLASAGYDQTVHLWNAATAQRTATLRGHSTHVAQVVWKPDGTRLASAGRDGTVKIWDTATGREALTLESHTSQVNAVAWSPDGMIMASAGEDQQIHIHDAIVGYVAARSSESIPAIDRRLTFDSSNAADWRLRAEIHARKLDWKQAAIDLGQYLLLKPHPTWFMLDGDVAGPYPEDLQSHFPPEEIDLFGVKSQPAADVESVAPVAWRRVPGSAQGIVDLGPLMEHNEHISCYAVFPIFSLDDQRVAILIGSDDQSRVWLNGECIYECLRSRTALPDEDAFPALLKSGWNTLLVRVTNETADHALYLRLSDAPVDMARIHKGAKRE
jgi:WD40 repeat protein/tRNA A-37 threonylcarbamoyl transferase component Bud32